MKKNKRVFKGISGMILVLVTVLGAVCISNTASAQCTVYIAVNQNAGSCFSQVFLFATASTPVQQWNYTIDGIPVGTNSTVLLNLTPGVYVATVVVITDIGCTATDNFSFTVAGNPLLVDAGADVVSCQAQTQLSVAVTSTNPYSVLWTPPAFLDDATSETPIVTQNVFNQWFIVDVIDDVTGCISSDTVYVTQENPLFDTLDLCSGSATIDLGPGANLYQWLSFTDTAGNNSNLNYPTTQQSITVTEPGEYFMYADFPDCGALTSLVTVVPCPDSCSLNVSSNGSPSGCGIWYGFAASLSGPIDSLVYDYGDGSTFTTNGISGDNYYPTGDYTLTVTAYYSDGCVATYTEQISVDVTISVDIWNDSLSCGGGILLVVNVTGSTGEYIYQWFADGLPFPGSDQPNPVLTEITQPTEIALFVSDSIGTCLSSDTITVFPNMQLIETHELCLDSILLTAPPYSQVYFWTFEDPQGNTTGLSNETNEIYGNQIGTYYCMSYTSGCNQVTHEFHIVECTGMDDVWPGDANSDNIVTNSDALYLGLAFNQTGPTRPAATLNWVGQPAPDWTFDFAQNNVNLKHADCDGNGIINFDDTLAIDFNYLQTHNKFDGLSAGGNAPIWVEATPDTVGLEQAIDIVVHLGTAEQPIDSLHGVAFTLTFDETLVTENGFTVDFDNCVLGTAGSDVLTFQKSFFSDGALDLCITRNTLENFQGYGPIFHARIVTTDNLSGMHDLPIGLSGVVALTAGEDEVVLSTIADTVIIDADKVGIDEYEELDVVVFPNPTNGLITILGVDNAQLTVLNAIGQKVFESGVSDNRTTIDLSTLNNGVYILKLENENGVAVKRLRILR